MNSSLYGFITQKTRNTLFLHFGFPKAFILFDFINLITIPDNYKDTE